MAEASESDGIAATPNTPSSNNTSPSSGNTPVTLIPCLVCGDRSSGRHYGVLTCDGCRGFFKRSVRRGLGYLCREKGQCIVDLGRRNQCQSCRLKKCLRVGMKREAVQHERAPRNKKHSSTTNEFSPYPPQIVYRRVPISGEVDMPVPVASIPIERPTMPTPPPPAPKHHVFITTPTELYEVCARILYEAISWARNIPTFSQLPLDDQAMLLEYSWSEIFLVSLAQLNIPLGMETMIKLAHMTKDGQKSQEVDKDMVNELVHIQSVVYKFKTLNLTSTEYACVKAIILFKPDLRRIQSRQHIENLQEQAQLRLLDSVMPKGPRARFGTILLKLSLLGEVSPSFIEKCFFKGGLENISEDFNSPHSGNQSEEETYDSNDQSTSNSPSSDQSEDKQKKQYNEDCILILDEHSIKQEIIEVTSS